MTEIVEISLEDDFTPKKRLRSFIRTFPLHPANNPIQLVAPFNPNRYKCTIFESDVGMIIATDLPTVVPSLTAPGVLPEGTAILSSSTGNGFDGFEFYGPDSIWVVAITGNTACRVSVIQTFWEDEHS